MGLHSAGLQVFPARYKDKITLVKWEKYQTQRVDEKMLAKWFSGRTNLNYWVMTGRLSGYIVIDCDTQEGDDWWLERVPNLHDTATVKTSKGHHYWFKIPDDWDPAKAIPSKSCHPSEDDTHNISFDLRADLTGVIVPPSVHETGFVYSWTTPLLEAATAPPGVLDGTIVADAPTATGDASGGATGTGGQTRSLLSRLLSSPPGGEGSGRNDWLTRVAGHYAKTYHNQRDLYETHMEQANRTMGTPLGDTEFNKVLNSVWRGEHSRNSHRAIDAACGYLASGSTQIQCQVVLKQGDERVYSFVEYADFDLNAKGVMEDESGRRTYWVEVVRKSRADPAVHEKFDVILRGEVLGDDRALKKYLAAYACTIVPPDNMWPKAGGPGVRIQRYLEAQSPPVVEITPALGFHDSALGEKGGGYVTHDGIITNGGLVSIADASVRADPRLKSGGMAPHEYGFEENPVVARDTLIEVLSFHDDSVTTVFGAWWAACLLKTQIEARTSLFPFMAIEAPSESGKTNGYFQMMTQLNGNTRGETQPTKAALRDMAAAHRNGIVWVDDLDDPAYLMELLRAATSGGSLTKMGEDRESVKNTKIVSPIVISGEALGLGTQKALIDRAIVLKAPSPTSRRSLRDSSRAQWDDVLAVREQYPSGLHSIAGWFVQDALNVVDETLDALREARTGGSGRAADKVSILRAGARLLDYLVRQKSPWAGRGEHARRLERWLIRETIVDGAGDAVSSDENALTLEVLPWALRKFKFPEKATAGDGVFGDDPVFIRNLEWDDNEHPVLEGDTVEVWYNCALLSEAWEDHKRGRNEKRTTTRAAFDDQSKSVGAKAKRVKIANSGGRLAYYRCLTGVLARSVVERAMDQ